MAKFKRLSRFLERIGIKKKQAKESVELASSSRSWRRFWKRSRMEHRTAHAHQRDPRHQSTTNDLSKIGRLFRVLKMKSSTSKCRQNDEDVARPEPDAAGDPEQDVAREGFGLYSDVSDSDNLLSSADTVVIVAGSSDWGDPATATTPICTEPSYSHDASEAAYSEVATREVAISEGASITEQVTGLPIVWDDNFSDLTSITDMTLTTDHDQLENSSLTSVTNLTTEDDVISMTSKSMKVKFDLLEIQGGKDEFEETQLNNNDQSAVSIYQLQCGGIKELVDGRDEGEQSYNSIIDDYVIVFLPVIVVIVFMFLLLLTGC